VIAPPSQIANGAYCFIEGPLDDVSRLPALRNLDLKPVGAVHGERNDKLFRHCMKAAHHVDDFDALLDVARTFNDNCLPPMEDNEVISTAHSAWNYTARGLNRFGQHGAWFTTDQTNWLIDYDQDAALLVWFLKANQKPDSTFVVANGLADRLGWTRKRLANARKLARELGIIVCVCEARQQRAAQYRWGSNRQTGQN
jgi:hypothetical protein